MKVFMLGWEFPPMISGGLGVACYGLAKALNAQDVDVLFLLPKPRGTNGAGAAGRNRGGDPEMKRVTAASAEEVQRAVERTAAHAAAVDATDHAGSAEADRAAHAGEHSHAPSWQAPTQPPLSDEFAFVEEGREVAEEIQSTENFEQPAQAAGAGESATTGEEPQALQRVTFVPIDAWLRPYMSPGEYQRMVVEEIADGAAGAGAWAARAVNPGQPPNTPHRAVERAVVRAMPTPVPLSPAFFQQRPYIDEPGGAGAAVVGPANTSYAGDLFLETQRYARLALAVARGEEFDVIHGHDWMTFEAAMAVAAAANKPLVLQIHSTEIDRAGDHANRRIMEIERNGMLAASLIIAVSYKTKTQLIERYGIDPRKIEVVYNATEPAAPAAGSNGRAENGSRKARKRVLFLGRLTRQKGPGYFLQAAQKVLSVEPDVKFILAGQGEMEEELKELASDLGIRHRVLFAGFLEKERAARALRAANVYVMPSVSEPFGLAPLEALSHDVPVIISKQSGVSEVLRHVLKVDFWDTDDLADKILAVLRHAPLAETLRERGQQEVRHMSWDDSAARIVGLYERLTAGPAETVAIL